MTSSCRWTLWTTAYMESLLILCKIPSYANKRSMIRHTTRSIYIYIHISCKCRCVNVATFKMSELQKRTVNMWNPSFAFYKHTIWRQPRLTLHQSCDWPGADQLFQWADYAENNCHLITLFVNFFHQGQLTVPPMASESSNWQSFVFSVSQHNVEWGNRWNLAMFALSRQ